MFTVHALSAPFTDWKTFIREVEAVTGTSPTRGLDTNPIIDIKDPCAFIACVDMNNNPAAALRESWIRNPSIFEHGFLSFLLRGTKDLPYSQLALCGLAICGKEGEKEHIYILSGTIGSWFRAILGGCNEQSPRFLREVMNTILISLKRSGYRELFSGFSTRKLHDGTFVMEQ